MFLWSCLVHSDATKIGIVVADMLLASTQQGQTVLLDIENFSKKIHAIIDIDKQNVLQQEQKCSQLRTEKNSLASVELEKEDALLRQMRQVFQSDLLRADIHIQEHRDKIIDQFCKHVCKQFSKQHGCDIVLRSDSELLVMANDSIDITAILTQCLHEQEQMRCKKYFTIKDVKELFKYLDVKYLTDYKYDIKNPKELLDAQQKYYELNPNMAHHFTEKYGLKIEEKHRAPIYLAWVSPEIGWGVFAAQDIDKDDFIQEYTGIVCDKKSCKDTSYAWYFLKTTPNQGFMMDAKREGNEMRFVNHSDQSNVLSLSILGKDGRFHVCYLATHDIKKDQQLLVDYGAAYWADRKDHQMIAV